MGWDIHVARKKNVCKCCGRADKEELFYCGGNFFKSHKETSIDKDGNSHTHFYSDDKSIAEVMTPFENYSGKEAIKRLLSIKDDLDEEMLSRCIEALKKDGAYFYFW